VLCGRASAFAAIGEKLAAQQQRDGAEHIRKRVSQTTPGGHSFGIQDAMQAAGSLEMPPLQGNGASRGRDGAGVSKECAGRSDAARRAPGFAKDSIRSFRTGWAVAEASWKQPAFGRLLREADVRDSWTRRKFMMVGRYG
jgi:hypothetical protein